MAQASGTTRIVRAFARPDLKQTSAMMARAFDDDPLMMWIFPDDQMRHGRLPKFFAASMRTTSLRYEGTEVLRRRPGGRLRDVAAAGGLGAGWV